MSLLCVSVLLITLQESERDSRAGPNSTHRRFSSSPTHIVHLRRSTDGACQLLFHLFNHTALYNAVSSAPSRSVLFLALVLLSPHQYIRSQLALTIYATRHPPASSHLLDSFSGHPHRSPSHHNRNKIRIRTILCYSDTIGETGALRGGEIAG